MSTKNQHIVTGQKWLEKIDGSPSSSWVVVSLSETGLVGLSGPGPCRSYQTIQDDVLLKDWELVRTPPAP
jgi:hypothetical protein